MADDLGGRRGVWEMGAAWAPQAELRLAEAVMQGRWLLARCRCGARGAVDARPWLQDGLGGLRLVAFEERLRCQCGARQARLSALGGAAAQAGPIHVFR
jgi:hypothetical protein